MPKAKIFVVEDERIVSLALQRALTKLDYTIAGSAVSGEAALEAVGPARPDLVLMDIRLQGEMDGVATAEHIRERHDLPVIYLTAYTDGQTLQRAKVTEPFGYIIKPFEERELQIAIETALYKHATEARLKKVERWLAATLRSIADAVIATDEEGNVTFLNPVAETITGWKSLHALGRPMEEVFRLEAPGSPNGANSPATVVGEPTRLFRRDGGELDVEFSMAPMRDEDGRVTGTVLVFRDVTERQRLEGQLRQLQKMESVGRLAAGLAHDFNNLLTVIQGHADALQHAAAGADPGRALDQISHAVEHAAKLTRQLLTFSRQQHVQLRMLDLNVVVEDIRDLIQRLLGTSVTVRFQPEKGLPAVQADASMMEQVLMNLAVNARDAMPGGGRLFISTVSVEFDEAAALARPHPEARTGHFVRLEVADTGAGMDKETLRRACEPFFTTKGVGRGTGLGLSTVYGIVQQHRGWLEIESAPGRGTVCRVFLPAEFHAAPAASAAPAPAEPSAGGRHETLLLVEDEENLRELVKTMLEHAGYTVIAAASGLEALTLWEQHGERIDLVLTDMIMPEGVSGRQLAEKLSALRPDLKVIYTSGYSLDLTDPQFACQEGFRFLEKPYRSSQLLALVRDCLDGNRNGFRQDHAVP